MQNNFNAHVALVGRPNVGKSRLYNRLLGRREAIVHDFPGVTRDLSVGEIKDAYTLMDTGGIGLKASNTPADIQTAIEQQVHLALEAADLILFVLEANAELNAADLSIAAELRSCNKAVWVIVNKTDIQDLSIPESHWESLGFAQVKRVSAEHGHSCQQLHQAILKELNIPQAESPPAKSRSEQKKQNKAASESKTAKPLQPKALKAHSKAERLRVCLCGRANVGKSSLANALLNYRNKETHEKAESPELAPRQSHGSPSKKEQSPSDSMASAASESLAGLAASESSAGLAASGELVEFADAKHSADSADSATSANPETSTASAASESLAGLAASESSAGLADSANSAASAGLMDAKHSTASAASESSAASATSATSATSESSAGLADSESSAGLEDSADSAASAGLAASKDKKRGLEFIEKFRELIVSPHAGTTRDAISIPLDYTDADGLQHHLTLVDTAGSKPSRKLKSSLEYFSKLRSNTAIESSELSVLMLDATVGPTQYDQKLAGEILKAGKGLIIAVNKWDIAVDRLRKGELPNYENLNAFRKDFETSLRKAFFFLPQSPIVFLSAKSADGLGHLLKKTLELGATMELKLPTGPLNQKFGELLERTPPRLHLGKRFKAYYAVQVGNHPFTLRVFCNQAFRLEDNYKRYLCKNLRNAFALQGCPIALQFFDKNPKAHSANHTS